MNWIAAYSVVDGKMEINARLFSGKQDVLTALEILQQARINLCGLLSA